MNHIKEPSSFEDIHNCFSIDAIGIMQSYIDNLDSVLRQSQIDPDQINSVLRGIFAYVDEYYEDKGDMIDFNETLNLMENLGSPNEIMESLNPRSSGAVDTSSAQSGIINAPPHRSGFQGMIDHPYITGVVLTYVFLFLMNLFWAYNRETDFIGSMKSSLVSLTLPSIVLGIIIGYAIQKFYEDKVSLKVKYDKILEDYQGKSIVAFILFFFLSGPLFGGWVVFTSDMTDKTMPWAAFVFVIMICSYPFIFGLNIGDDPVPEQITYFTLLRYKERVQEDINLRFKGYIKPGVLILLIIGLIWNIVYLVLVNEYSLLNQLLSTLFILLYAGSIVIGTSIFKSSSWKLILEDISRYEQLS